MKKSLIALVLAVSVQVALSTPRRTIEGTNAISDEVGLTQSKRFKLIQLAYKNLRKTVWPDEVYPKMSQYMNEVKEWTDNDETLKKSSIYEDLQEGVHTCLKLLEELNADPDNCDKQLALRINHDKVKALLKSHEIEKVQYTWISKYADFALQMRDDMKKSFEKFYTTLAAGVGTFIKSLDEIEEEQEVDILQWYEKFNKETDFIRKQILAIEFMGLFPDERSILETKCKIKFSNGL